VSGRKRGRTRSAAACSTNALYVNDEDISGHDLQEPFASLHALQDDSQDPPPPDADTKPAPSAPGTSRRRTRTGTTTAHHPNSSRPLPGHKEGPAHGLRALLADVRSGKSSRSAHGAPPTGTNYNLALHVEALETLLRRLPRTPTSVQPPHAKRTRTAKRLSPEQAQELVAAYQDGATVYQLGHRFGVSRQTASKILHRHGVAMRMTGLTNEQTDEAARLYETGWTVAKIGKHLQVSPDTVRLRLIERGVPMRPRGG
jgi:hypothetical protein